MKRKICLIVWFMALSLFSHISQAQILNGNFEEWDVDDTVMYGGDRPEIIYKPKYWSKLAYPEFYTLLNYVEHPKKIGKSLCLYSYAFGQNLSLCAISMFVYGKTDSIYSKMYNKWIDSPNKFNKVGMPYSGRPKYFGGVYIMFQKVKTDTALAQVILRKYNPINKNSDTIGIGKCYFLKTTDKQAIESDFIPFSVEIDYQSNDTPDTLSIILASNKNQPDFLINNSAFSILRPFTIKAEGSELYIDDLYLSDKVMSIPKPEIEGLKVWYNKESRDGGYLYIQSEQEREIDTRAYSSNGKESPTIPSSINLKVGINKIPIQRNSPSELLYIQLLDQRSKLPIGSMKIY